MENPPLASRFLAFQAMPDLAAALRERKEIIMQRWQDLVYETFPNAHRLTLDEVRDTLPIVLDPLARALEAPEPAPTAKYVEVTKDHGRMRFIEDYKLEELLIEYRLLRHILLLEIGEALGGAFNTQQIAALSVGIDIAMEQATANFVRQLAAKLRDSAEAELKFLSYLSHDLRGDLNSILLTIELVIRRVREFPELQEEADDLFATRGTIMSTIGGMERLLQAERLRKQTVPAARNVVHLNALIAELVSQMVPAGRDKGIAIETDIPDKSELRTDRGILQIILQNLLGNAIKYSAAGTVRIAAQPPANSRGWKISVTDQGPGIAPERQELIFHAFTRGETLGQPGVGLGLTIASQGARLLGAGITLNSTPGAGSTFSLVFPADPPRT